jgi:PAS domain S-box-containing protein
MAEDTALDERPKKSSVLYLNSYHHGYRWSDDVLEGFLSVISKDAELLEMQIEYMDTKKYDLDEVEDRLFSLYTNKFSDQRFDVVVASDNNAVEFYRKYNKDLFAGAPLVFCGINDYDLSQLEGMPHTGVMENIHVRETLELALKLHPDKKRIVIVGDESTTGGGIRRQIMKVMPEMQDRLKFEFWHQYDFEDILARLETLSVDSIIYFIPLYVRMQGASYTAEELMELVSSRKADIPLYSNWEFLLGHGTVGGKLLDGVEHGRLAAESVLRILNGEKPDTIPIEQDPEGAYVFDYLVLERMQIDKGLLPQGSRFINAPKAFYELDKEVFWTIMISLVLLFFISIFLVRNIVKRRFVEKKIKDQLSFLEIMLDTIPLLICWKDQKQRYLGVNRSFMDFYKLGKAEELLERVDSDITRLTKDEHFNQEINMLDKTVIETKQPVMKHKTMLNDENGGQFWLELTKVPLRDEKGNVVGTLSTAENITQRVSLERQLIQSQKMEAIGTLAGGLAHDFNNILTSIINSAELVLDDVPPESMAHKDLKRVLTAAGRGSGVVKQILTFSRPSREGFMQTDISETFTEALHLLKTSFPGNILLKLRIDAEDSDVFADPNQIHQVVMNLGTNAYQAMRETGGSIEASLENIELNKEDAGVMDLQPGRYLKMSVADTGPGIPLEIMDKVFDPFFTTKDKHEGTGLGLAVVHGIIRSHKGAVRLQSKPGEGTAMDIFLPLCISAQARTAAINVSPDMGWERVLFVEDDDDQLATTPRILESLGYRVTAIKEPEKALEVLKQRPDDFDLLITDYDMPGMNGLELADMIRLHIPDLPVIMISGREYAGKAAEKACNVHDVLMKPYNKSDISQAIRRVFTQQERDVCRASLS